MIILVALLLLILGSTQFQKSKVVFFWPGIEMIDSVRFPLALKLPGSNDERLILTADQYSLYSPYFIDLKAGLKILPPSSTISFDSGR